VTWEGHGCDEASTSLPKFVLLKDRRLSSVYPVGDGRGSWILLLRTELAGWQLAFGEKWII
jgi:hypothetical protein